MPRLRRPQNQVEKVHNKKDPVFTLIKPKPVLSETTSDSTDSSILPTEPDSHNSITRPVTLENLPTPIVSPIEHSDSSQSEHTSSSSQISAPLVTWKGSGPLGSPGVVTLSQESRHNSSTPYLRRSCRRSHISTLQNGSPKERYEKIRPESPITEKQTWLHEIQCMVSRLDQSHSPTPDQPKKRQRLNLSQLDETSEAVVSESTNPFPDSLSFIEFTMSDGDEKSAEDLKAIKPTADTTIAIASTAGPVTRSMTTPIKVSPVKPSPPTTSADDRTAVKSRVEQARSPSKLDCHTPNKNSDSEQPGSTPLRRYQSLDSGMKASQAKLIEQKRQAALNRLRSRTGMRRHGSMDSTQPNYGSQNVRPTTGRTSFHSQSPVKLNNSHSPSDSLRKLTPPSSQENTSPSLPCKTSSKTKVIQKLADDSFPDDEDDAILTQIMDMETKQTCPKQLPTSTIQICQPLSNRQKSHFKFKRVNSKDMLGNTNNMTGTKRKNGNIEINNSSLAVPSAKAKSADEIAKLIEEKRQQALLKLQSQKSRRQF